MDKFILKAWMNSFNVPMPHKIKFSRFQMKPKVILLILARYTIVVKPYLKPKIDSWFYGINRQIDAYETEQYEKIKLSKELRDEQHEVRQLFKDVVKERQRHQLIIEWYKDADDLIREATSQRM